MSDRRIQWKRIAAEIAAIVFGILIAFWIDATWQRRQEIEAEQEILASLDADLQSSLDGLRSHWLPMHSGALEATGRAIALALDLPPTELDPSRVGDATGTGAAIDSAASSSARRERFGAFLAAVAASRGSRPRELTVPDSLIGAALVTATYDPTVSSLTSLLAQGDLNRIRDRELRTALSVLPGQLADAQDEERAARDHVDRRLRPLLEAAGDMTTVNLVHWSWLEAWAPPASSTLTFRLSPELLGALALRMPQQVAVVSELSLFANALEQTLELIRAQRR